MTGREKILATVAGAAVLGLSYAYRDNLPSMGGVRKDDGGKVEDTRNAPEVPHLPSGRGPNLRNDRGSAKEGKVEELIREIRLGVGNTDIDPSTHAPKEYAIIARFKYVDGGVEVYIPDTESGRYYVSDQNGVLGTVRGFVIHRGSRHEVHVFPNIQDPDFLFLIRK